MLSKPLYSDLSSGQPVLSPTADKRLEIRFFLTILLLTNLGLLIGDTPASNLLFLPSAVSSGEWWRLLSWPFVHVSRYHLILDGAAFLLLYGGLKEKRRGTRIVFVITAAAGSLLLPLLVASEISLLGLCGLSGPAHGLMAISTLEMRQNNDEKKIGSLLIGGLLLKTVWELITGTAFLQQLHIGNIGQPIVSTHAGGVIAGLISFKLRNLMQKNSVPQTNP